MEDEHEQISNTKDMPNNDIDSVLEQKEIKEEEVKAEDEYEEVDYKEKYKNLKRKLKSLLYEQECFHEELRKIQRKCLRVSRDKSFLLDRLLQYEQPEESSDEELTDLSSVEEEEENEQEVKKKDESKIQNTKKSKFPSKTSNNNQTSSTTVERSRCKYFENNKQCVKMVSKKIKSGICQTHRQLINKQDKETKEENSGTQPKTTLSSTATTPTATTTRKPPIGGKDISQIREAMEASSRIDAESSSENENEDDDLVIDLPH